MAEEDSSFGVGLISLYDLVARILPGCTTVAVCLWARRQSMSSVAKDFGFGEGAGAYLTFVAAGFVVGTLLTAVAGAFFELLLQALARVWPKLHTYTAERTWQRIDAVGRRSHGSAEVLAKIAAEGTLCQNLLAGAFVALAVSERSITAAPVFAALVVLLFALITRLVALQHRLASFEAQWLAG